MIVAPQQLRQSVTHRPALVLLHGLPGSGKSHLARAVAAEVPAAIISSDRVRGILVSRPVYSEAEHRFVHDVCFRLARRALSLGLITVLDATNLQAQHRQRYRDLARVHQLPYHLVVVDTPEQTIRARLRRRSRGESLDGSEATEHAYEILRPTAEPIAEPHLRVRGDGNVRLAVQAVLALLWTDGVAAAAAQRPLPALAVASAGA